MNTLLCVFFFFYGYMDTVLTHEKLKEILKNRDVNFETGYLQLTVHESFLQINFICKF